MSQTILILTNRIPYPLRDGGALAMDAMIRGYKQAGWTVHLLAMNTMRHRVGPEIIRELYQDIAGFEVVEVDNTVRRSGIISNLLFSREPEHAARFRSGAYETALGRMLSRTAPDVVQLESPFLASYLPGIRAAAPNAVVVYRMHNIEGEIWTRLAAMSTGWKGVYLRILAGRIRRYEEALWRQADLLLPITAADGAAVLDAGVRTPQVVAPFGIVPPDAEQRLPDGPFKVYHLGAMDWLPNQEAIRWFLQEVWPKVHAWSPEITFHFGGRAMPESFKEHLPESVFCAGEVPDAVDFVADKHLLVVPLRAGGGIRVKILEAMAQGKLVVSTSVGMQGIEAQGSLHYLGADDAQLFAHYIAWASSHLEKAEAITWAAQNLIREHYDIRMIMQAITKQLVLMLHKEH